MSLKGVNILVVDDDEFVRETLKDQLEVENAKVTLASDGNEAYELITKPNSFDIVLSDIRMPNCTGIELVNKVRNFAGKAPDIILISAFTEISSKEAKQLGAKGIFLKKNIIERLLEHVQTKKVEKKQVEEKKLPEEGAFNILNFTIK